MDIAVAVYLTVGVAIGLHGRITGAALAHGEPKPDEDEVEEKVNSEHYHDDEAGCLIKSPYDNKLFTQCAGQLCHVRDESGEIKFPLCDSLK